MSFWTFSYIYFHMDVFSFALFPFNQEYHHTSEKAMAPHSSTLAWKIPRMEEPGRLQSMGLLRVRHDWANSLSLFTFMHWEREMATHSSVLAWRIPGMGEPGGLPSMGSHRVGHDWSDLAAELPEGVNRESSVTRCSGCLVSVTSLLLPLLTSPGPTKNYLIYPESDRNSSRPAYIWNYTLLPHSPQAHPSTGAQPLAVLLQNHL